MDKIRQLLNVCEQGDTQSVLAFLDDGIDVDSVDEIENTPLQVASANGHDSVVRLLLMRGAALDKCNIFGWTALMQAARYGHVNVVALLLQHKADFNARNRYGATALTLGSRGGHLQTVKLLVEAGMDLFGLDGSCEFTPFMIAALHGHDTLFRFFLDRGCDVNYKTLSTGLTPLMVAALNGHMTTSQILIERGADPNVVNVANKTALDVATVRGRREVRGYLERKTTNTPKISSDEVKPDIIECAKRGDINRIKEILDKNITQRDACSPQDGATPLMFAAMTGRLDIAQLLVERGCDVNKQDTISGWTALMQATYHGKKNVALFLINADADVTIQAKNGCTAFDMASLIDDVDTDLLRILASKAMQVNKTEKGKKTAKQNGSVTNALDLYSFEEQQKSGLKADLVNLLGKGLKDNKDRSHQSQELQGWWSRLSNRFRNLKFGRSTGVSNHLSQLPFEKSLSVQDLTVSSIKTLSPQSARLERKASNLVSPEDTNTSITSYQSVLLETKKSANMYTLDINPPHSSVTSETLKPVIPPFLPPPSFALDEVESPRSNRRPNTRRTAKSVDENVTMSTTRSMVHPMKLLQSRSTGSLSSSLICPANPKCQGNDPSPCSSGVEDGIITINVKEASSLLTDNNESGQNILISTCDISTNNNPAGEYQNISRFSPSRPFLPSQNPSRLFMPRKKSVTMSCAFRNMSNTTSPNSSTSGSSSITPQRSKGKSTSSKESTASTLTPSPSPTPGKLQDEIIVLDSLNESSGHSADELPGLLRKLSLEKYSPIFEEQEVDMEAFLMLTDRDLKELGITNGESRSQILKAIVELNAGKGRERQHFLDTMTSFQSTLKASREQPESGGENSVFAWNTQEDVSAPSKSS